MKTKNQILKKMFDGNQAYIVKNKKNNKYKLLTLN